ncbi:MAG: hypothetical protein COV36_00040 [Alphaproteobacteria bacterium CG11_big_fil_rev_8_21_14_0_20_44_7]|nr:MAG: hypothetical protein COV36_00040 [Alphaproteobacteria bacterium CG11_big_fil_rev_8_21_14_0_20_44_7]
MWQSVKTLFKKAGKGGDNPILPDELPRFVAFPFVLILNKIKCIHPEHLVFAGLLLKIVAAGMIFLGEHMLQNEAVFAIFLLFILLDYTDGMLARVSNRVSLHGGLLDLASDFIGAMLIMFAMAYHLGDGDLRWALGIFLALLLIYFIPLEVFAFESYRAKNQSAKSYDEEKAGFYSGFLREDENGANTKFLKVFYYNSWGSLFVTTEKLFRFENSAISHKALCFYSLTSVGLSMLVMATLILFQVNLAVYLAYQLVLFAVITLHHYTNRSVC